MLEVPRGLGEIDISLFVSPVAVLLHIQETTQGLVKQLYAPPPCVLHCSDLTVSSQCCNGGKVHQVLEHYSREARQPPRPIQSMRSPLSGERLHAATELGQRLPCK